jgi:hypothetical protein
MGSYWIFSFEFDVFDFPVFIYLLEFITEYLSLCVTIMYNIWIVKYKRFTFSN